MNQKTLIAILVVVVIILIGTTVYFTTINKASQPVAQTQPVNQEQEARPLADCSKLGSSWTQFSNSG
ncbi:TPA: hypothetical protein DCZ32_01945, partial [Candidatus Uhrbacteria bacterium]|nr:hypothetical protein [Candidatus Uhrbacteria bacterium]